MTPDLADLVARGLDSPHIRRVAFVGLERRWARAMASALPKSSCTINFFSDYEKAKEWLIPQGRR